MRKITINDILDIYQYEQVRAEFRRNAMRAKDLRRIHIGEYITLLFENELTIRYQVQEMMRTERIVKNEAVQFEIDIYNELIGINGDIGCTMMIEIDDPQVRDEKLKHWLKLPESVYLKLSDGTRIRPQIDERQRDEHELSSVQFLIFRLDGQIPIAVGTDYPELMEEVSLTADQMEALAEDLG